MELPDGRIVRRRILLSFSKQIEIKYVLPMTSYVHASEVYMEPEEFKGIKEDIVDVIDDDGILLGDGATNGEFGGRIGFSSIRGLENMIGRQKKLLKKRIYVALDAVLDEQQRQWDDDTLFDDNIICEAHMPMTLESRVAAARRALQDEIDIESYVYSTRRYCCRLLSL